MIESLEKMLDAGKDSALLRFSLGGAYLHKGQTAAAINHLAKAVELDPEYTAAWKFYGRALNAAGDRAAASNAWTQGIRVAARHGDRQAEKEMQVFLKRLESGRPLKRE